MSGKQLRRFGACHDQKKAVTLCVQPTLLHTCLRYAQPRRPWRRRQREGILAQPPRRSAFTYTAAAAQEVDTTEDTGDGLNGFVPTWVQGNEGPRPLPEAAVYQQTLQNSFTLGGIGLHTGQYSYVRVRPAFAGEGRYFVVVQPGTNSTRYDPTWLDQIPEEGGEDDAPESLSGEQTARFLEYLNAQDNGYEGSYLEWSLDFYPGDHVHVDQLDDYYNGPGGEDVMAGAGGTEAAQEGDEAQEDGGAEEAEEIEEDDDDGADWEEIEEFDSSEDHVLCCLDNMDPGEGLAMDLVQGDLRVKGVEHLLAALEALGVDNARIEIEGGEELPIYDGSALAWAIQTQAVGLRPAPLLDGSAPSLPRTLVQPSRAVSVTEGSSFIAFQPTGGPPEISCGVNHEVEAPVIGRQWYSWLPGVDDDHHFRRQIAPARTFIPSLQRLYDLRKQGYFKGGTIGSALIGYGERWYESQLVRYEDTEPPRHKVCDLVGDLSLLASNGNAGMPLGHIVAYNADHTLHARFLRELYDSYTDAQVLVPPQPGAPNDAVDDDISEQEEEEEEEGEPDKLEDDAEQE